MENPIKMDDLGGPPLFLETPISPSNSAHPLLLLVIAHVQVVPTSTRMPRAPKPCKVGNKEDESGKAWQQKSKAERIWDLLMKEILRQLACLKPSKYIFGGIKYLWTGAGFVERGVLDSYPPTKIHNKHRLQAPSSNKSFLFDQCYVNASRL